MDFQLNYLIILKTKLKNNPSIKEFISVNLSWNLIQMTKIKRIDRSVLYQEFKGWILNFGENEHDLEIPCLRYLNKDRKIN